MVEIRNRYRPTQTRELPGLRYERCCLCNKEWNISKKCKTPDGDYVCPVCRQKGGL